MLYVRSYWGRDETGTSNIERRTVEENANIEHRTPNFQRRTEEIQREKENAFCLFLSLLMFDVRCSRFSPVRFDVGISALDVRVFLSDH